MIADGRAPAALSLPQKIQQSQRVKSLRRRDFLTAGLGLPLLGRPLSNGLVAPAHAQEKGVTFEAAAVRALARGLAQKPYKAPGHKRSEEGRVGERRRTRGVADHL